MTDIDSRPPTDWAAEIIAHLTDLAEADDPVAAAPHLERAVARWRDEPGTLALLRDLATDSGNQAVRRTAVKAISLGWRDAAGTLALLRDYATTSHCAEARQAALLAICEGWPDDPHTLPMLLDLATRDPSEYVRQAAVVAIEWGWRHDPGSLPTLRHIAVADKHWQVREAAVRVIGDGWRDDPQVLEILDEVATADSDEEVRDAAVEAAADWELGAQMHQRTSGDLEWDPDPAGEPPPPEEPEPSGPLSERRRLAILAHLRDLIAADRDGDEQAKVAAAVELVAAWRDDHRVLRFLHEVAAGTLGDRDRADDEEIRVAALRAVVGGWRDDPGTVPLMERLTAQGEPAAVRDAAERALDACRHHGRPWHLVSQGHVAELD